MKTTPFESLLLIPAILSFALAPGASAQRINLHFGGNAYTNTVETTPATLSGPAGIWNNLTNTAEFVAKVLGPRVQADTGEWGTWAWSKFICGTPGMRIAGGSDETLRNIVSERVLGLPKEPGIDSKSPFKDIRKA